MKHKTKRKINKIIKKTEMFKPFTRKESNTVKRLMKKIFGSKAIYNHLLVPDVCFINYSRKSNKKSIKYQ